MLPRAGRSRGNCCRFETGRDRQRLHCFCTPGSLLTWTMNSTAAHPASEEEYFVSDSTAEKSIPRETNGGRVIAVGTTVVRALESVAGSRRARARDSRLHRLKIDNSPSFESGDGCAHRLHERKQVIWSYSAHFCRSNKSARHTKKRSRKSIFGRIRRFESDSVIVGQVSNLPLTFDRKLKLAPLRA